LKKILFLTLLISSLFAESQLYLGAGYNYYNEQYTNNSMESVSLSDNGFTLKVGYGERKAYAVEFSVDYIDHADYSATPIIGHAKYGFNVAMLKAFDFDIYLYPYLKVGMGTGILDNFGEAEKSLQFGSFNLAGGVFIPIDKTFDIEISYDYRYTTYQKENSDLETNNKSDVNCIYIGINTRF